MAKSTTPYISNPLEILQPSITALRKNPGALIGLLGVITVGWLLAAVPWALWFFQQTDIFSNTFNLFLISAIALSLIAFVVSSLLYPASNIVLVASAQDKKIGFKEAMSQGFPYIWRSLGVTVLTMLAVLGGLLLFIVPGIIFFGWFILSPYVVVHEKLGMVDSMKRSKQLVKGRLWELYGLISLPTAASIIPFIGPLVSFVVSIIMIPSTAIRYVQLLEIKPEDRPAVHWSNYLVLVSAALASSVSSGSNSTINLPTDLKQ